MKFRQRIRAAWQSFRKGYSINGDLGGAIRAQLRQGQPGTWASDHRAQAEHFTGWNYVAVHTLAKQAMQASCEVFREVAFADIDDAEQERMRSLRRSRYLKSHGEDDTETEAVDRDHPLHLLLKRPNPHQSGGSLRYEIAQQISLTGTALIVKVRNSLGQPAELYCVPTALITPVPPCAEYPTGGWQIGDLMRQRLDTSTAYNWGYRSLARSIVPDEDMIVIRWPNPLWRDEGFSALEAGAWPTDTAEQLDTSRYHRFLNQVEGSVSVEIDKSSDPTPEEVERFVKDMRRRDGGAENTGNILVPPPGCIVTSLSTSPQDMDYVEGFNQLRDTIMAMHQVTPVAAGIMGEHGSRAAFYVAMTQFGLITVEPFLTLIADELTEQLAVEFEAGLIVALTAKTINDPELLEQRLATDIAAGSVTKNEVRLLRGLDEWTEEQGGEDPAGTPARRDGKIPEPPSLNPNFGRTAEEEDDGDEDEDDDEAVEPGDEARDVPALNGRGGKGKPAKPAKSNGRMNGRDQDYVKTVQAIVNKHWRGYP